MFLTGLYHGKVKEGTRLLWSIEALTNKGPVMLSGPFPSIFFMV